MVWEEQEDTNFDGIGNSCDLDNDGIGYGDNCPTCPNGLFLGTCIKPLAGVTVSCKRDDNPNENHINCSSNDDCSDTGGACQKEQGDCNDNGIGDACECYADCNCDNEVNLTDLIIMKEEFLRDDCEISSCRADCNCDTEVNLTDLLIMKTQFLRDDCPDCASGEKCGYE